MSNRGLANNTTKNTLPWWYVCVTVGHVFCHACTSMKNLWQNQDSHTCAVVEVFHDITKIIITEVSTYMTINRASWKCFRQGWPTCGMAQQRPIHVKRPARLTWSKGGGPAHGKPVNGIFAYSPFCVPFLSRLAFEYCWQRYLCTLVMIAPIAYIP